MCPALFVACWDGLHHLTLISHQPFEEEGCKEENGAD